MKRLTRPMLICLLIFVLVASMMPMTAFADATTKEFALLSHSSEGSGSGDQAREIFTFEDGFTVYAMGGRCVKNGYVVHEHEEEIVGAKLQLDAHHNLTFMMTYVIECEGNKRTVTDTTLLKNFSCDTAIEGAFLWSEGVAVGDYVMQMNAWVFLEAGHAYLAAVKDNVLTKTCDICGYDATATLIAEDAVYTGAPITTGASVVYDDDWTDAKNHDEIIYTNNIDVGDATVKVSIEGNALTTGFQIHPADLRDVYVEQKGTLIYDDGEALTPAVTTNAVAVNDQPVTFTYSMAQDGTYDAMPVFTEVGTYTVYYRAAAPYHNETTGSFTVTVENAAPPEPPAPSGPSDTPVSPDTPGTPDTPDMPAATGTPATTDTPQTGDRSNLMLWFGVLAAIGAGILGRTRSLRSGNR